MAPNDNTVIVNPGDTTGTLLPNIPNIPGDTTITTPPPYTKPSEESSGGGTTEDGRPRPDVGVGGYSLRN